MPGKKRPRQKEDDQSKTAVSGGRKGSKKPRLVTGPLKCCIAPKKNTAPDAQLYISAPKDRLVHLERKEINDFLEKPKFWTWDMLLEWAICCWFCNQCLPYETERRVAVAPTDWWTWISHIEGKPTKNKPTPKSTVAPVDPDPSERPLHLALKVASQADIFSRDFIVLPVNLDSSHWVLAVLVNIGQVVREETAEPPVGLKQPMLFIANSMTESFPATSVQNALELWLDHCASTLAPDRIRKSFPTYYLKCPQQTNSHDCGFYMVHFLYCIWRHLDLLINTVPEELDDDLYKEVWRPDQVKHSRVFWKDALKLSLELEQIRQEK